MPPTTSASPEIRIITHMNKDHTHHLSLYLQHYLSIPARTADTAKLLTITTSEMQIQTTSPKQDVHVIPFDPPMSSLGESRERLVKMAAECQVGRPKVERWTWPTVGGWLTAFGVVLGLVVSYDAWGLEKPDGVVRRYILMNITPLADLIQTYHAWLFWAIIFVHGVESVLMVRALDKYGLKPSMPLWWAWLLDCSVEGAFAWRRVWKEVERVEGGKH